MCSGCVAPLPYAFGQVKYLPFYYVYFSKEDNGLWPSCSNINIGKAPKITQMKAAQKNVV